MAKQTMGEFLSILRKAAGYTQQDIAEKLNVSAKTVSSWETDRTCPDLPLLPILAEIYGVTCDELLRGERNRTSSEGESEELTIKRTEKEEENKEALLKKNCSDFWRKANLMFGLSVGCTTFYVIISYLGKNQFLLSLVFLMGFLLCGYLLQFFFNKAFAFCGSDGLGLQYRRDIAKTYYHFCQKRTYLFLTYVYAFIFFELICEVIRPTITNEVLKNVRTNIVLLIFGIAIRIVVFFIKEKSYDKTLVHCISSEDSVIFLKKRALVKKRFYLMQSIVSALCLLPVFLYLFGVIAVEVHWALAVPVLLLLQKIPIHLYYAQGRGMKHIVLPEEAPVEQEKSA